MVLPLKKINFADGWKAAMYLDLLDQLEILGRMDQGGLEMIVQSAPAHIAWVQRLPDLARQKLKLVGDING